MLPYDVNNEDQLDLYPAAGTPARDVGAKSLWTRLLWEGGRPIDAFLTIVSAQVGQVSVLVGGACEQCAVAATAIRWPALPNGELDTSLHPLCTLSTTLSLRQSCPHNR